MKHLPTGTVCLLRTDLEGSMALVRSLAQRYDELNAEHLSIVRDAIDRHDGHLVRTEGDAVFAVFADAGPATRAAVDIQGATIAHGWLRDHQFRVRIGLPRG